METGITFGLYDTQEAISLGIQLIRADVPQSGSMNDFIRPLVDSPLKYCFILHDIARNIPLLDAMKIEGFDTSHAYIEPFNEREKGRVTSQIMINGINAIYNDCKTLGYQGKIVASGDSALSGKAMRFYKTIAPKIPPDVIIAFHDYPYEDQREPNYWPAYHSHDEAIRTFLDTIQPHPGACSEFGFHTAQESSGRLTEEDIYNLLIAYFQRYARFGLVFAVDYQWKDGSTDTAIDRYGIHFENGTTRKRQAAALLDWRGL